MHRGTYKRNNSYIPPKCLKFSNVQRNELIGLKREMDAGFIDLKGRDITNSLVDLALWPLPEKFAVANSKYRKFIYFIRIELY